MLWSVMKRGGFDILPSTDGFSRSQRSRQFLKKTSISGYSKTERDEK